MDELALSLRERGRGEGRGEEEAGEEADGVVRPLEGADLAAGELLPEEGEGALFDAEEEEGRGGKFCDDNVATEAELSFLL